MSRNIEVKARIRDIKQMEVILKAAKGHKDIKIDQILIQEDVFFSVPNGRLKLRKIEDHDESELIYYDRPDNKGPKVSDYCIAKSTDTCKLLQVLSKSLGIKGCIKKTRHLIIIGQTRVHIDKVEGLGNFIELEVALNSNQTESEGQKIAEEFMELFSIKEDDLIACAYLDMPK